MDYEELPRAVFDHQVAALVLVLPPLLLLLAAGVLNPSGALRQSLRGNAPRLIVSVLLGGLMLSLLLDCRGVWPFTWRSPRNSASIHVATLLGRGNWLGLMLLAVRVILITPVVEEVVFRYVLLREATRLPGGKYAGVLVSATAFAALHLAEDNDPVMAYNASWLFFFSIVLGWTILVRQGKLGFSLAAHASRNIAELLALCLLVVRSV